MLKDRIWTQCLKGTIWIQLVEEYNQATMLDGYNLGTKHALAGGLDYVQGY